MQKLKKIDIHVHSVPERFLLQRDGGYATPEELRYMYDRFGIEAGVLLPEGAHPECSYDTISQREACEMVRRFPQTFAGWFCNINPLMGQNATDTDLSFYLNQLIKKGAKGIGELTLNRPFDDPYVCNLFHHAEQCGLPVTFHIGAPGGYDYGLVDEIGLPRLEKVLAMFPRLKFLGHSQKFWAEIGGRLTEEERSGYPQGKVQPGGRVVELMRRYPNLCGDLSAGSGCNALMRDPEFAASFLEEFQDRLFFGTDICRPENIDNPMLELSGFLDDLAESGKISFAAYEKVSRGNALALLRSELLTTPE
ncbi:MAG: amidohydrolase family protein [Acutalibacteraceae bacterium]|jgi:predicted TIM-barrel fold metal-dependent hydrolase